jgi:hypothetical protein
MKPPSKLSQSERRIRSQLHLLIREANFMRASLITLKRKCGKARCRCLTGELHASPAVEQSRKGKTRLKTLSRERQEEVKQWIENWHKAQELLESLSELQWNKLETKDTR